MALLGPQLVLTLIMVSVIQKLSKHYSFAKWLLCSTGLKRYLHPTDDELRNLASIPKPNKSNKNHSNFNNHNNNSNNNNSNKYTTFHVPRNLDINLETCEISSFDIIHLRYFTEYQWLVDFGVYSAVLYLISEIYHSFYPLKDEINLSLVWCLLTIFFALKLLINLTILYFKNEESIGERSMCIVAFLFYMLIAMITLIIDENTLETGLAQAYVSFNHSASEFLIEQGLSTSGPASKIVIHFFIAISCGLLGSIFTFPGLRMARMHWDSLKYCEGKKYLQVILNISFILPFLLVLLWIRPISRDYLTVRVFSGMERPLLNSAIFETIRILLIIFIVILRIFLMPIYLQSYLNIASDRIQSLKQEAGRITNMDLQRKISSIFYYLCVVTLQFIAPLILCLYLTFLYKNLSGFNWSGIQTPDIDDNECTEDEINNSNIYNDDNEYQSDDIMQSANHMYNSWKSFKNVFSKDVYKGFLGFATWWSYFTLFASSAFGMLYQSYFKS